MKRLKSKAGFTLVELVVVIAIMAILAGVGTVGYGAYIKSANKGADKTLVGNIVRSIETGINSYAFPLDEVLQVAQTDDTSTGGLTVPLGFVVVTNEGTTVYAATSSEGEQLDTGECVHATIKEESGKWYLIGEDGNKLSDSPLFVKANNTDDSKYSSIRGAYYGKKFDKLNFTISQNLQGMNICFKHSSISTEEIKCLYGSDDIINPDKSNFVEYGTCGSTKFDQYANDIQVGPIAVTDSCSLNKNLVASFGDTYPSMKLKGDWSKEETSIATYWSNADGLMKKVQSLTGLLNKFVTANQAGIVGDGKGITILGAKYVELLGDSHDSETDLLNDIAYKITTSYTEDTFAEKWLSIAKSDDTSYAEEGFGVDGREYYSSLRIGFNSAFASYVKNASCGHASKIEDFGTSATKMITSRYDIGDAGEAIVEKIGNTVTENAKLPYLVCKNILKGTGGETFTPIEYFPVDDASDKDSFYYCDTCLANYNNWIKSGTCENDARAFYQTMQSVVNLPTEIKNADSATYFDYFSRYASAMNRLYTTVENAIANADSAVVIEVFYDGEQFNYAVSPTAENPRKE